MSTPLLDAAVAVFGSASSPPTEDQAKALVHDADKVDLKDLRARDASAADALENYLKDPDAFVMGSTAEPRNPVWGWMVDGDLSEPFPSASAPSSASPPPATPAPTASGPAGFSGVNLGGAAPAVTGALGGPSPGATPAPSAPTAAPAPTTAAPKPAAGPPAAPPAAPTPPVVASPAPSGGTTRPKRGGKDGKGTGKGDPTPSVPPARPASLRSANLPAEVQAILATPRWAGFRAGVEKSFTKSRSGDASAAGEIDGWKRMARGFRDGTSTATFTSVKLFGRLLLRLIEAYGQQKDVNEPDWFKTNFVTGTSTTP